MGGVEEKVARWLLFATAMLKWKHGITDNVLEVSGSPPSSIASQLAQPKRSEAGVSEGNPKDLLDIIRSSQD